MSLELTMTPTLSPVTDPSEKKAGPGGKHDNMRVYTPDEAALVLKLVEAHAPRWTHIAKLVSEATNQERTAASIRNYYKRFCASKKIAERDGAIKKLNRCQLCGEIKRGHICKPTQLEYNKAMAAKETPKPKAAPASAALPSVPPPSGGLALSAADDEPMPPLAPAALASLDVDTPGASPISPFSFSGPLSLGGLSMLGSPSALARASLGLPTPAVPPSADPFAPFHPSNLNPFASASRGAALAAAALSPTKEEPIRAPMDDEATDHSLNASRAASPPQA